MADYLVEVVQGLLPQRCYDEYFTKYNFFDESCMKITISKLIGIAIIAGSVLVKIPQVVKILGSRSADGISITGVLLEIMALTSSMAYNYASDFPFSSWGESLFLSLQTVTIAFLILAFGGQSTQAWGFLASYLAAAYLMISGLTPLVVLWVLQASTIPVIVCSKLIQAKANYQNGSTGQLSAVTVFLLFGGAVARVLTSIQETGDPLLIATYVVASLSNGLIAGQVIYYWKSKGSGRKGSGKAKGKQQQGEKRNSNTGSTTSATATANNTGGAGSNQQAGGGKKKGGSGGGNQKNQQQSNNAKGGSNKNAKQNAGGAQQQQGKKPNSPNNSNKQKTLTKRSRKASN